MEATHKEKRRWIGIDAAIHAMKRVARMRLEERCGLPEGRISSLKAFRLPLKVPIT